MILQTNGQEAELLSFVPGAQTVHLETAEPMELGEALEVWTELEDGPFLLASYTVADWLRVEQTGGSILLTQLPVPTPTPAPEPAQVAEDNNTAAQLAIAELAETLLGGETSV